MTLMCGPVTVTVARRDGSAMVDVTNGSRWQFETLRSRIGTATVTVGDCGDLSGFDPWCDLIRFDIGGATAATYLLGSRGATVTGVGMVAQLNRRRFGSATVLAGGAFTSWLAMFDLADGIDPLVLPRNVAAFDTGALTRFEAAAGEPMLTLHDQLAGVHAVYSEHGGMLRTWPPGTAQTGPAIHEHWVAAGASTFAATVDGSATVNEVIVRYGRNLDRSVTWPPAGMPDPGGSCRLQGRPLELPEVEVAEVALAEAERAHRVLSRPQVVVEDVSLDPDRVEWGWLIPGRDHVSALPGTDGQTVNLDQVVVSGVGGRVTEVSARWDQVDLVALGDIVRARI